MVVPRSDLKPNDACQTNLVGKSVSKEIGWPDSMFAIAVLGYLWHEAVSGRIECEKRIGD